MTPEIAAKVAAQYVAKAERCERFAQAHGEGTEAARMYRVEARIWRDKAAKPGHVQ